MVNPRPVLRTCHLGCIKLYHHDFQSHIWSSLHSSELAIPCADFSITLVVVVLVHGHCVTWPPLAGKKPLEKPPRNAIQSILLIEIRDSDIAYQRPKPSSPAPTKITTLELLVGGADLYWRANVDQTCDNHDSKDPQTCSFQSTPSCHHVDDELTVLRSNLKSKLH